MLGWTLLAGSAPLLSACGAGGGEVDINVGNSGNAAPWADDIQSFAANVRSVHPDPNGITRGAEWQSLLAHIIANAGQKSDKANLVACLQLAVLMRDEHTQVSIAAAGLAQTPVRFASAADGYWVQQASDPALLGARLLAIDGTPIANIKERSKAFIPAATAAAYNNLTATLLHQAELLWLAGIGLSGSQSNYLLKDLTGVERTVTLPAGGNPLLQNFYGRPGGPPTPLWLSQPDKNYFMSTLPGSQSVYVRYARCAVDPATPITAFFNGIDQALSALPAPRLIFDLRNNGGGDSSILANAIQQRGNGNPSGPQPKIAVLIDNGVYSSATINLYDLRRLGARTFGESPGTPPNHTGEIRSFMLPRTGTQHTSSTKIFSLDPALGAANYMPDVVIGPTIDDRVNGRDPILERAESFLRTGE
ncbi:MAG: hypothetical protein HY255_07890 [Betaproteobacteria bacterium]|nr:hypothetical protein [Betaproteobacteria bacterium]